MASGISATSDGISDHDMIDDDETQPPSPHPIPSLDEVKWHDGRIVLSLSPVGLLHPSFRVRAAATDSFQSYQEEEGYCWANVTGPQRDTYFEELRKSCYWDESTLTTAVVREKWNKVASLAYSDFVSKVKKRVGTPKECEFVNEETMCRWKAYWATEAFKKKSEIASRNRRSEPNGPGTGVVIHHGGSKCAERHCHEIAKANGIRPEYAGMPTSLRLHCKNDVWTDARAKKIYEEVESRVAEERVPLPGTLEERIVTAEREQEIYREVVKVNPKGRVLGQGCLSQLYVRRGSRGGSTSYSGMASIRDLEARLQEKEEEHTRFKEEQARKDAARDEEMKAMRDQIAHFASFLKELSPAFAGFHSSSQQ